jgi:TldD protein
MLTRREFLGAAALAAGCATARPAPRAAAAGLGHFADFGVDETLLARVLGAALERGGEHADLFFEHRIGHTLGLDDGTVKSAASRVALGCGVRVSKGNQTGYAFSDDLDAAALVRAARTAAVVADGPARLAPRAFRVAPPPPASRYPLARPWRDVGVAERLPLLAAVDAAARAADRRVGRVEVSLRDEESHVLVADSTGRVAADLRPLAELYCRCGAEDRGQRRDNVRSLVRRAGLDYFTRERLEKLGRDAVEDTIVLFDAVAAPAGEMPVVLGAGASGILLHEAIGHGMEADFNRRGISIYADRIGKPIARPFVSVVDDGTQEGERGALNIDDEGNPGQRTLLVDGGVLATYLHDGISARWFKAQPTGSGRRESYQSPPMPRMRSTYMLPGPHHRDEIIASVKRGIFCSRFQNGKVNIGAGDFTFYVKNGWLIEDGRLTRPITDVNIIGNGPKVLEKIDMVADDLAFDAGGWTCGKNGQQVPVSLGMPTVRVAALTVGGRA